MNRNPVSILTGLLVVGLVAFGALTGYRKMSQDSSATAKAKAAQIEKNRSLGEELKSMMEDKKAGKKVDEARLEELQEELYFGTNE